MPSPPRVLIVDDHADSREATAEFLQLSGFATELADGGEQALHLALSSPPDAIVLDLAMPGLDGWATITRLGKDLRTRNVPIITLTALLLPREMEARLLERCCAVFSKPCDPAALVVAIRRAIGQAAVGEA